MKSVYGSKNIQVLELVISFFYTFLKYSVILSTLISLLHTLSHTVLSLISYSQLNNLKHDFLKILLCLQRKDHLPSTDPLDYHVIAVNAAPLARGHSLLLPYMNRCAPQVNFA